MPDPVAVEVVVSETLVIEVAAGVRGPRGAAGGGGSHVHDQPVAATLWTISHGLGYFPAGIVVIDTAGTQWDPVVSYVDENSLTLTFNSAVAGTAYLS